MTHGMIDSPKSSNITMLTWMDECVFVHYNIQVYTYSGLLLLILLAEFGAGIAALVYAVFCFLHIPFAKDNDLDQANTIWLNIIMAIGDDRQSWPWPYTSSLQGFASWPWNFPGRKHEGGNGQVRYGTNYEIVLADKSQKKIMLFGQKLRNACWKFLSWINPM